MSQQYVLIVYTSPADGRADEYNAWYDDVHLGEFAALPGVISARRFQVAAPAAGQPQYAAVYELSSHPDDVVAAMFAGIKEGTMHMSDALDMDSVTMTTLVPC